jgi:hypothetical protein
MAHYKVTCLNGWSGKTLNRTVQAESVLLARVSKSAVSNHMMANGWYVSQIDDMQGNMLFKTNVTN